MNDSGKAEGPDMPHDAPPPYVAYEELSTPSLENIDRKQAIVILPIGPLEEHGPHLPFGVDAFNADYVAEETARLIGTIDKTITVVKIPVLYLGTHVYRAGGSLWTRQRVVRDLIVDYGRSLVRHGFRRLIIVSAHGGPRHFVALEEAAAIVSRERGVRMISLTSRIVVDFLLGRYGEQIAAEMGIPLSMEDREVLSMDYHAGWWETSMMLLLKPHLVDRNFVNLPPALVRRSQLRPNSPWTVGPGLGYLGAPAAASIKFARASVVVLGGEIRHILEAFLAGTLTAKRVHSPLFYIPVFRTNFRRWLISAGLIVSAGIAVLLIFANR